MSKSIFASKTLWANILMAALAFLNSHAQTLPLSPDVLALIMAGANIGLRLLTTQPAHIVAPA